MQDQEYRLIALNHLEVSATNPRKHFSESSIDELAQSINEVGVIEPLVVRPKPLAEGDRPYEQEHGEKPLYEIVSGERRYRGAKKAGLTEVPCMVRILTDDQVFDIQITENLQREDVNPLDEADAFKTLLNRKRCSLKEIAERFGKSEDYVFGRIRLTNLIDDARKFLEDDVLPVTAAIKISMLKEKDQKAIIKRVIYDVKVDGKDKKMFAGLNELKLYFDQNILMPLRVADFNPKNADLCPAAGACTTCSKRTGNNLLNELYDSDKCLDSDCYKDKHIAHYQQLRDKMAKKMKMDVVFAGRFYGIEREYKALGEIIPMQSYNSLEDEKARPKNALYAVFVGPDRTKTDEFELPEHGWIEVTQTVMDNAGESDSGTIEMGLIDQNNVRVQEQALRKMLFTHNMFNGYKEAKVKSPDTMTFRVAVARMLSELNIPSTILVDIVTRYKLSFPAQQIDGNYEDITLDNFYQASDDIMLSIDENNAMAALMAVNHSNIQRLFSELMFISVLDDDDLVKRFAENLSINLKSVNKVTDKQLKAKLK